MLSPDSKEELSRSERDTQLLDVKNPFTNNKWVNKTKKKSKLQNDELEEGEVQSEKHLETKSKTAPNYPLERWGHQTVVVGQYMYLIGGYIDDAYPQVAREQIYRLDCETYEWEKVVCNTSSAPEHRDSHSLCLIQGKIYLFGGKTADERVKNDIVVFDTKKHEWKKIDATGTLPLVRESHQACSFEDRYMIVFGGTNGKEEEEVVVYDDMYIFDTLTNAWREVTNKHGHQIEARDSFSMTNVNGFVYVFGGQGKSVGKDDVFYNDFYKLKFNMFGDGKSETVEILTVVAQNEDKKPCVRASHSMCVFKDRYIFIIAGEKQQETKLDDIWAYDIEDNVWIEVHHKKHRCPLKPIISLSSSVYQDQIIIFGGLLKEVNSDQTLILQLNYVDENKLHSNSQESKKTCNTCEVVYNLTDQQKEKQKQLEQALKNNQIDDEDNIRIDVDREDIQLKHPEVFENENKGEDGGNETEVDKPKLKENDQNAKQSKQNSGEELQMIDEDKQENTNDDQANSNELADEQADKNLNQVESEKKVEANNEKTHEDVIEIQENQIIEKNENEMDTETDGKPIIKKDENDMDEEQEEDQDASIKEENDEKRSGSGTKLDQFDVDSKDDSVLESEEKLRQQEINKALKKEMASQGHQHQHQQLQEDSILTIRQPYISMSFLNSISNLIGWPFTAFGLLVHNAKSQFASTIQINLMCQKKKETYINIQAQAANQQSKAGSSQNLQDASQGLNNNSQNKCNGFLLNQPIDKNIIDNHNLFLQIYDDSEGFPHNDFVDIMYKFDSYKVIQYNKAHKELIQDEIQLQSKAQYGNNIKLAGLRLGQNVLFISKNKTYNILNVGLISSSGKINPNLQECIIFLFSIDMKKKVYLTESGDQNKRIILNNIAHLMNEEQLFKHDKGNYIYIFDLKRIPLIGREGYEFQYSPNKPDIISKKKNFFKEKKEHVEKLIDYSLKSYLQHLYVKIPENMHFCINGQRYEFLSYQNILTKQKGMRFLKELNIDNFPMVKDSGKVTIYEQTNYNPDQSASTQSQAAQTTQEQEQSSTETKEGTTTRKNTSAEQHQGILLYQDERLIGRAESHRFGSYFIEKIINKSKNQSNLFKYVGVIELDKFFTPNLFYNGLENAFQEAAVRQCLKQFLKAQKQQTQAKSEKIRSRSSDNIEEPELRKELKTD
ncbi:hypothetical protein ABPG72_014482 [Tetrahymena utriculariae]